MFHAMMSMAVVLGGLTWPSPGTLPESLDLTEIRAIPSQHDGRWPPLDTVARDVVRSVTGTVLFQQNDPVLTLLAWTFDAHAWERQPLIAIRNAELRAELRLPPSKNVFSYAELTAHQPLRRQIDALRRIERGRKPNPLESKVAGINERLGLLRDVFAGRVIRLLPAGDDALAAWSPIGRATDSASAGLAVAETQWQALKGAFLADDAIAFSSTSKELAAALSALPAAYRPDAGRIATELRYNELQPFGTAWRIMAIGAVLALGAMAVRRRWFDVLAAVGLLAGFATLTYGLTLRWQIAGRIPASNMYESLLFLGWGTGAFAIVAIFVLRDRIVPLTASALGAVALMLADLLPMDPFIRPIAPVLLDTVWMSIHVPIIMVSYSVLALGVVAAHAQMITMAFFPKKRGLSARIDSLHYWYIHVGSILLLAGIVTGSMWAASSWGRYWGWDPKEVWSLVALLGYLTILHVRIDAEGVPGWAYVVAGVMLAAVLALLVPHLTPLTGGKVLALCGAVAAMVVFVMAHGPMGTAFKSILCFWLIVMTYVGVNYVLGTGLHSYGFGTGAVVRYMFLVGVVDLTFIALCTAFYLLVAYYSSAHKCMPLRA